MRAKSLATRLLAASALAMQTINAIQVVTQTDSQADAMQMMDKTWPEDNCCRIYRYPKFEIRDNGTKLSDQVIDLCTDNIYDEKVFDFSTNKIQSNGKRDWDNWMSSFKCGKNVAARFCRLGGDKECEDYMYVESAAGGAENQMLGIDNKHTKIVLTPYNPELKFAATVFSKGDCNGHSHIVWVDMD